MFLIVEGEIDRLMLDRWARVIGINLDALGIRLVPAGGDSSLRRGAARQARLSGDRYVIVVDGGQDIADALAKDPNSRGDVRTHQLSRSDIEGYLSSHAIEAWLRMNGFVDPDVSEFEQAAASGHAIRALNALTHRYLGHNRSYDKMNDGPAIAALMTKPEIHPEIVGLVASLVD